MRALAETTAQGDPSKLQLLALAQQYKRMAAKYEEAAKAGNTFPR